MVAELCPHLGTAYQAGLMRLRQRLAFETTAAGLVQSLDALDADLAEFSHRAGEYFDGKSADVAAVLELTAQSVETFETRDQLYLERLSLVVRQMENGLNAATGPDDLRVAYEHQHEQLKAFLGCLSADSKAVFDQVRGDIGAVEERLRRAEAESSIDPLTSLVNRRELERLMRKRILGGKVFCLLLFDIRSLGSVNERFTEEAGDQVLKQFGARLAAQVRPRDIVARWGGDEFAVIFDCTARDADARAQQVAQWVSGRYPVRVREQDWKPEIDAAIAVIEYQPGEDEASFLARVSAKHPVHAPEADEAAGARVNEFSPDRWRTM